MICSFDDESKKIKTNCKNDSKEIKKIMSKQFYECKNCKKIFTAYKNRNFCSKECRVEYSYVECECEYCKNSFKRSRSEYQKYLDGIKKHLYCSRECADKGQIKSISKQCLYCKKNFITTPSEKDKKYCSRDCYEKDISKKIALRKVICKKCGKQFTTYHKNQEFCSRKCSSSVLQKRVECKCDTCGKAFFKKQNEVNVENNFCCKYCAEHFTWSQNEINILKEKYNNISNKEIYELFNGKFTIKQIRRKAQSIGLGKPRIWTNDEESILKDNFSKLSFDELVKLLPDRTITSMIGKARQMKLYRQSYEERKYSENEIKFIKDNFQKLSYIEIADKLNRTPYAIEQKTRQLGLKRKTEIKKDGYRGLTYYIRSRLTPWKNKYREECNYTCALTGVRTNIIVHHIRSFNLLLEEAMKMSNMEYKNKIDEYTDDELNKIFDSFFYLQEFYGQYVCINEDTHKEFHKRYGYGNNTIEQWEEFIINYN